MATEEHTRSAFFYGTLMSPAVLERVTGREFPDTAIRPAILHNYRRHRVRYADYPAIVPTGPAEASTVRGTLVDGITKADIFRLDVFEGSEYIRLDVKVGVLREPASQSLEKRTNGVIPPVAANEAGSSLTGTSVGNDEEVSTQTAQTYVWQAPRAQLESAEWDFDEFVREKLWRWAPGHNGEDNSNEYKELDAAVDSANQTDPTGGRALGGGFEDVLDMESR